jgi:hypothetical protein
MIQPIAAPKPFVWRRRGLVRRGDSRSSQTTNPNYDLVIKVPTTHRADRLLTLLLMSTWLNQLNK